MLESVWRKENPSTCGGNVNWCSHYGKQYRGSLKNLKTELLYDPTISLLGIYLDNHNFKRYRPTHVHCSTIYNSQNMGAT